MDTEFLDRLAKVMKTGKNAACQRAIERVLARMKKRCEDGQFKSSSEAELAFRRLIEEEAVCRK
jgi:hypothetical protein